MKSLFLLMISLFTLSAQATDPRIKSWKTLTNENGYSFKYPDCWTVVTNNPDETEDPVTKAKDIAVEETKACARPQLDPQLQNGIGISAGWTKTSPKEEILKKLERLEKDSSNNISRKDWMFFKHFKIDSDEAYIVVNLYKDVHYNWIRWEMTLYCPKYEVIYGGPAIKNPDQSYLDRFKAGDIALPEPEKTIFESIHCTDSKK